MNNRTIYIVGDSTAESKLLIEKPMSGWGEFLQDYLYPSLNVSNHAVGGRSSKSFISEGRLDIVSANLKEGDFLLIQFGHNDQKEEDPTRYTEAFGSYQENLKMYIEKARENKTTPVLLSSISRRIFINTKVDRSSLGNYPKAMEEVANNEGVIFININQMSADYLDKIGEEKSKSLYLHLEPHVYDNYPEGLIDNTHFSEHGGKVFAKMIANELENYLNKE